MIFVHCSDASRTKIPRQFDAINNWHRQRFGEYCQSSLGYYGGYTLLIEPDGSEHRYREDHEETCAAKGYNHDLHVCLSGDFDIEMPTQAQINALKKRLRTWCQKHNIEKEDIQPHRSVNSDKTCYGSLLSDDWAQKILEPKAKDMEKAEQKLAIERRVTLMQKLINKLRLLIDALQGNI